MDDLKRFVEVWELKVFDLLSDFDNPDDLQYARAIMLLTLAQVAVEADLPVRKSLLFRINNVLHLKGGLEFTPKADG